MSFAPIRLIEEDGQEREQVFVPIGFAAPIQMCACGERVVEIEVEEISNDPNCRWVKKATVAPGGEFGSHGEEPGIWRDLHKCSKALWRFYGPTRCRACHEPIAFQRTKKGEATPINLDGKPHWATCTSPEKFRRRKAPKARQEERAAST